MGDTIVYDIFIENQGNVTISNLDFTENLKFPRWCSDFIHMDQLLCHQLIHQQHKVTLNVAETERYRATFVITPEAANTGEVRNTLLVQGDSPGQTK